MREVKGYDVLRARKDVRMARKYWKNWCLESEVVTLPAGTFVMVGTPTRYGDVDYDTDTIIQKFQGSIQGGFFCEGWKTRHYMDTGVVDEDVWQVIRTLDEDEKERIRRQPHFRAGAWMYDPATDQVIEGEWDGWKRVMKQGENSDEG